MHLSRSQSVATAAIIALLALSSAFAQDNRTAAQPDIRFTVSMPRPYTHLLEVEMRVRRTGSSSQRAQTVDLLMPVWTPGSYLVREFERHVQDFTAAEGSG